jgi:hypothetical protein
MGRNQPAGELGRERTTTSWAPPSYFTVHVLLKIPIFRAGALATVSPCARSFHGPWDVCNISDRGNLYLGEGWAFLYIPRKRRTTHH